MIHMDLGTNEIMAATWADNLLHKSFPRSLKEASDTVDEMRNDIEIFIENCRKGEPFNPEKLNKLFQSLKEELDGIDCTGAAQRTRDIYTKKIVPNGWHYAIPNDPEEFFNILSHEKGNEHINYQSWWIKQFDTEFVRISTELTSIDWEIHALELDNQPSVYVASVPAWQIDMVSRVPAIEKKISHNETSRRMLDQNRKKDSWQRQINKDNKNSISSFFDSNDTFFANPVIIHSTSDQFVSFDSEDLCKISLDFSSNNALGSLDSETGLDKRPFTIIDGQHRVRGAANSSHHYNNRLLVIILPPSLAEWKAGKLFAEINTLSKELDTKHRLFLAHRFFVSSPEPLYDFCKFDGTGKTQRARANRLSYDMAARMLLKSDFWWKKIKILKQNTETQQVMDIEKWLKYSYRWFTEYPYNSSRTISNEETTQEILNYFEAWRLIIGDDWEDCKLGTCLFKSKTQARILLNRFQQVYVLSKTSGFDGNSEIKSVDDFIDVLSPLKNIPFTNTTLLNKYISGATPENSWKMLESWVCDALKAGGIYTQEEIMDTTKLGVPGAGIISEPPSSDSFTHQYDRELGLDPIDGKNRYVTVTRPNNCYWVCKPEIWKNNETKLTAGITLKSKHIEQQGNLPIRLKNEIRDVGSFKMRIIWSTIGGGKYLELDIATRIQ